MYVKNICQPTWWPITPDTTVIRRWTWCITRHSPFASRSQRPIGGNSNRVCDCQELAFYRDQYRRARELNICSTRQQPAVWFVASLPPANALLEPSRFEMRNMDVSVWCHGPRPISGDYHQDKDIFRSLHWHQWLLHPRDSFRGGDLKMT